ncbi:MAG: hypothetical protein IKM97_03640 [Clostridia bacterium]|nr:hypothetical protein [Clostridia bacterium]
MNKYILMFEYNSKEFMDINKIIIFKQNLERVEKKDNEINMVFYGEAPNEEFATFMSYFNNLIQKEICKAAISIKKNEFILENGINNKSIKLSAKNAKEIKNKQFDNAIKEFYKNQEVIIKVFPTKNWESIILDLIGE